MKVRVHLAPFGQGTNGEVTINIQCGPGEQILRWLAFAACARLAYQRGDIPSLYVPQSVLTPDGQILDVDIVLNELFEDGDDVHVEYSSGPMAFQARWDGRPKTPQFQWGEDGAIPVSHMDWLLDLDLKAFGIDELVNRSLVENNPGALDQDLNATKEVLIQYGGALQALFKYYESQGDVDTRQMDKMPLGQFRNLILDSNVTSEKFPVAKIDETFNHALSAGKERGSKPGRTSASKSADLQSFMLALIHCAAEKMNLGLENPSSGYAELSVRLTKLLTDFIFPSILPGLSARLQALDEALTPAAEVLLKKGRRLTEQTLDSCQLKRAVQAERTIDVKYLCTHLTKWGLLGKHFDYCTFAVLVLKAKHGDVTDPQAFEIKEQPFEVNYNEFERLLLAIAYHMYTSSAREEPFEEFLGETLDDIYKRAGVLVEVRKEAVEE